MLFTSYAQPSPELLHELQKYFAIYLNDNRYLAMAREFNRTIVTRPWLNHCIVARQIGARSFGLTIDELLAKDHFPDRVDKRQKIFAFTRVVTGAHWTQIARVFNRDHSTIIHACEKYEATIRAALEGNNAVEND